MKKNKVFLTVIFIITVLVLLWTSALFVGSKFKLIMGAIIQLLLIFFVIGAAWFLYRKEWRSVLGLNTKGITKKVMLKSAATGLLIGVICNIVVVIGYFLLFKEKPKDPLGEAYNPYRLLLVALILAPLVEELLFRGFIQGLWQKLYSDKDKSPTKLIIVVTALLFAMSHFGFLFNITLKEFFFSGIGIFIAAIYLSWLRHKYQSIIPSMFAHFGVNASMVVTPLIAFIVMAGTPGHAIRDLHRQSEIAQYKDDTTSYNFDPNNMDEWKRSYDKFAVLERPRSEELIKHLKGQATNVYVYFTIDTCGNIYNVYVNSKTEAFFIENFGYSFTDEAIQFIKSLPQCKPYVVDGKKVEKEMGESVPFYPY